MSLNGDTDDGYSTIEGRNQPSNFKKKVVILENKPSDF